MHGNIFAGRRHWRAWKRKGIIRRAMALLTPSRIMATNIANKISRAAADGRYYGSDANGQEHSVIKRKYWQHNMI